MDNPIHILIYYLYVFILSKVNYYKKYIDDGEDVMLCRYSDIKTCEYDYEEVSFEYYKLCISFALFDDFESIEKFPETVDNYIEKFYQSSILSDDYEVYSKYFKEIYFDFYLEYLKLSAFDEKYNHLYKVLMPNLIFDRPAIKNEIQNGKIDISQMIKDETFMEIAEHLFYEDLFENFSKTLREVNYNRNMFFKFDLNNYNESLFSKEINKRFFDERYTEDEVRFILTHHDNYNLQAFDIINESNPSKNKKSIESIENINKTEIQELNRFLMKYQLNDIGSIISNLNENVVNKYNIFDMLFDLCDYLGIDTSFRYEIIKSEEDKKDKEKQTLTITSKIDADSIYESSKSLSESIYNLVYDYYGVIYNTFVNSTTSDNLKVIYYDDNESLTYSFIQGDTADALMNSNFYYSIYTVIIDLQNEYKNNEYINESKKLIDSLYNNYAFGLPLEDVKKKNISQEITNSNDINYENDIKEYDTIFKENTYKYLMDYELDYHLYLPKLEAHIKDLCKNHNVNNDYAKGISAKDLEEYFNIFILDSNANPLTISNNCNDNYESMYNNWDKNVTHSLIKILKNKKMKGYMNIIAEDFLFKSIIFDDIINNNNNKNTVSLERRSFNSYKDNKNKVKRINKVYLSNLLNKKKMKTSIIKREIRCTSPPDCRKVITNQISNRYENFQASDECNKMIIEKHLSMFPEDYFGKIAREKALETIVGTIPDILGVKSFLQSVSQDINDIIDNNIKTFEAEYENRGLSKINNIHIENSRDVATFHRFNMQSCRNAEVKFLRLAKDYNRNIEKDLNGFGGIFKKLEFEDIVGDFNKNGNLRNIKFKIIEKPEERNQYQIEFKKNIIEMFSVYLNLKYGEKMKGRAYSDIPDENIEISNEINEFNHKLAFALTKETIFAKDIGPITKDLIDIFDKKITKVKSDKEEKILDSPERVLQTINELLDKEFVISRGYEQMIDQINKEYFGCNSSGNCLIYKVQTEKQIEENKKKKENLNKYDRLSSDQRESVRNIIFDTNYNLEKIENSNEQSLYYYQESVDRIDDNNNAFSTISPTIEAISKLLDKENSHNYIIPPKKYTTKDERPRELKENEFIVYEDTDYKIQKPEREISYIFNYNNYTSVMEDMEYIIPKKGVNRVYVVTEKHTDGNGLSKDAKYFTVYEDNTYDILTTDNKGNLKIRNNKFYKLLYLVEEVNVEFADVKNPFHKKSKYESKNLVINEQGKITLNNDLKVLFFEFESDKGSVGQAGIRVKSILSDALEKENSYAIDNDEYKFSKNSKKFSTKIRNKSEVILRNLNNLLGKRKKNKNGKKGKN